MWEDLLRKRTLPTEKEELQTVKNGHSFPIAYCNDTTDTTNPSNFMPMILKKIKQDKFQLYHHDLSDLLDNVIDWDGDNGLANTWGIYHKYPDDNFLLAIGMNDVPMSLPNLSDDGVEQGNSFGNQATLPDAIKGFGIQDTHFVLNDAQDDTDDGKQVDDGDEQGNSFSAIKLHL